MIIHDATPTAELFGFGFASSARPHMTPDELRDLYLRTLALNTAETLTGAMVYADGDFMEYIEGPLPALTAARRRILAARRHGAILELIYEPVPQRCYGGFDVATTRPGEDLVLSASTARWVHQSASVNDTSATGLRLLRHFWDRVR